MRVITGKITSKFGERTHPITKEKSFHNGVDVSAPVGTPVYSPIDGEVMEAYIHATGGKTLIIADATKTMRFSFAHLNNNGVVAVGDKIERCQKIAESGNTGASTAPHLHFGVKVGGRWSGKTYTGGYFVNSEPYLEIK